MHAIDRPALPGRTTGSCLESPSDQRTAANSGPMPFTPSNIAGGTGALVCSAASSASRSASAALICASSNSSRSSSRRTCGDVEWSDRGQRQPAILTPGEELMAGPRVSPARVRIADIRGKEFNIAPGGRLAGVGDQRRHQMAVVGRDRERAGFEGCGKLVVGGSWPLP